MASVIWFIATGEQWPDSRNRPSAILASQQSAASAATIPLARASKLTAADLAFGERQVEQMVKDRPEMLSWVEPNDAVWTHCARAFGGDAVGERIFWDSTPPTGDVEAEHQGPYQGDSGFIRVRETYASGFKQGQPVEGDELWGSVIYELENIRSTPAFHSLFERACRGGMGREEWIRENTRLEYLACRRTRDYFRSQWQPLMTSRGRPISGTSWFADLPSTYEEWIAFYTSPDDYPWNFWGRYYDTEIAPYLRGR